MMSGSKRGWRGKSLAAAACCLAAALLGSALGAQGAQDSAVGDQATGAVAQPLEPRSEEVEPQVTERGANSRNELAARSTARQTLVASLTIFMLAVFVGFEVIAKVPPTLHTPLMSGSNAISGITIVGALIVAAHGHSFSTFIGFLAVILATINVAGGFLVTHRMLAMFKRK